jgi:hypothetical protein
LYWYRNAECGSYDEREREIQLKECLGEDLYAELCGGRNEEKKSRTGDRNLETEWI